MYDELETIHRAFSSEVEKAELAILRGEGFKTIEDYKVACAKLITWERAKKYVEDVKKKIQREEE